MAVNLDKVIQWKADIALSVDMYNAWFMEFAPVAFRNTRLKTTIEVEAALKATENLTNQAVADAAVSRAPANTAHVHLPTYRSRPANRPCRGVAVAREDDGAQKKTTCAHVRR